jgi:hypothetical protein
MSADSQQCDCVGRPWLGYLEVGHRMGALSRGIRAQAKRRQVHYLFLFMRANGGQLARITSLIDDGTIRPVMDRVFPFASTKEAMAYVEGRLPQLVVDGGVKAASPRRESKGDKSGFQQPRRRSHVTAGSCIRAARSGQR